MIKKIFLKSILVIFVLILLPGHIFAGGIAGDGQYHYLAESNSDVFGDTTFFVDKNITIFENGAVLKEQWEYVTDHWKLTASYWLPNKDVSIDPPVNIDENGIEQPVVINNVAYKKRNYSA